MTEIKTGYNNSDIVEFCKGLMGAILELSEKHTEIPFRAVIPTTICELSRVLNYHKKLELVKHLNLRWRKTN